eukprot:TRINITY_DN1427_c0_g1_i1.p1 TRINITY_DN1427_c0_g1~~TRINITY_DN1427_c0_g1_i1.p1  ORF type:complete len:109 (+),score=38.85 TRINITY_DN1427_c0_g1_i1:336-662(+)
MGAQEAYFDRPSVDLNSNQIRDKLAQFAGEFAGNADATQKIRDLITFKTTPNGGIDVTDDLKYCVKIGRQNGIHVTPTALWDGLVEGQISSSWGEKEWSDFLKEKVTV